MKYTDGMKWVLMASRAALLVGGVVNTAQASDALQVRPAPYANADISKALLLGGKGNDWGHYGFCSKDGACTVLATTVGSVGSALNYLVADFDASDKPVKAQTLGGSGQDGMRYGISTRDGGFLLGGPSSSRFWDMATYINGRDAILKLDYVGKLQWVKLMQNAKFDRDPTVTRFSVAAQAPDGSFILAGQYSSPPEKQDDYWPSDVAVLKIGPDGGTRWLRRYHFPKTAQVGGLLIGSDGHIRIYGGLFDEDQSRADPLLVTLDADGAPLQAVEYVGDDHEFFANAINMASDGKLMLSGEVEVFENRRYVTCYATMLRVDPDGSVVDSRSYLMEGGFAASKAIFQADDTLLIGHTGSAVGIVRPEHGPEEDGVALILDTKGDVKSAVSLGTQRRNPRGFGDTELFDASPVADGKYFLVGSADAFGQGDADILTAVWTPTDAAVSQIKVTPLSLKAQALDLPASISMDIHNVRDLPIGRLDVSDVKIEAAEK